MSWLSSLIKRNRASLDLLTASAKEWLKAQIDAIDAASVPEFKEKLKERIEKL